MRGPFPDRLALMPGLVLQLEAQAGLQQAWGRLIYARVGNLIKTVNYLIVSGRTELARSM